MKVFYSDDYAKHAPAWYLADGSVRPCPEVPGRVDRILGAVRAEGHEVVGVAGGEEIPAAVGRVHAGHYLEYLRTIHGRWHGEFGTDVLPDTFPRPGAYHVKSRKHPQPGDYCFDLAAPIVAGTWGAAVGSARCAVAAADFVLAGGKAAYALCRPPGHHAGADYCGGFCYLNNVAIAAEAMILKGANKVAIVDVDYHHGNGTQDIFYRRSDVLFVSIHADPETQYPYFWGRAEQVGEGAGAGFNLNLPLSRKCMLPSWFGALEAAVARINLYKPESLLISLGADIHESDPVGDFPLETGDFEKLGRKLRDLDLPTVIVQEGGYNLERIGECVAATLRGFER